MKPNENDIDVSIMRFLAGEATAEESVAMLQWIEQSDDNRRMFLERKNMWDVLHPTFREDDIDTDAALSKMLRLIKQTDSRRGRPGAGRRRWMRLAAVLMLPLMVLAGYMLYSTIHRHEAMVQTVRAPFGSIISTSLPDGSKVWLNANSRLTYSDDIASCERRTVQLSGEGYFEVSSDANHPFVVSSGDMEVEATGTAFNVNAYGGTLHSSVTLVKGSVSVTAGSRRHAMACGQRYINENGGYVVDTDDAERYCSWREGIIMFRDEPLREVLGRIEQIYNVRFEIADRSVGEETYNATFRGESLEEILRLLQLSTPIFFDRAESPDSVSRALITVGRL